mmetsp:Transcript_29803/g.54610  ORF Transcript_29803/g.54610 Transcript_29803/m.54610 type:complete len:187 (-) Transcript_29803:317-877(-)
MFREGGHTTAAVIGSVKKLHTTFEDGSELVEEYDVRTDELLVRKKRDKTAMGKMGDWIYLAGEAPVQNWNPSNNLIKESSENPVFSRKDVKDQFQWRIRNLPYPPETYQITVEDNNIVIRTTNKKYFKRISIPELEALRLPVSMNAVTWSHAYATLVVSYQKPKEVLEKEAADAMAAKKIRVQASI